MKQLKEWRENEAMMQKKKMQKKKEDYKSGEGDASMDEVAMLEGELKNGKSRLHNVIHKQWIYQNSVIHDKGKDGHTIPQHHNILNCVEEYSMANPKILLPQHCFLYDTDFAALSSGPTSHCLLWLADMEAAAATSQLALSGTLMPEAMTYFLSDNLAHLSGLSRQVL